VIADGGENGDMSVGEGFRFRVEDSPVACVGTVPGNVPRDGDEGGLNFGDSVDDGGAGEAVAGFALGERIGRGEANVAVGHEFEGWRAGGEDDVGRGVGRRWGLVCLGDAGGMVAGELKNEKTE